MIFGALLLAAAPPTAVDAERAFARDAQTQGQWTAFRKWAAPDAILFVPQPVKAHDFLKGLPDPKLSYQWWPAQAFLSCDGQAAVTTGPSVRGTYRGYFTTVWRKQPDGQWRWLLDHGDAAAAPRPARDSTRVRRAACPREPLPVAAIARPADATGFDWQQSPDRTLTWSWTVKPDRSRVVEVHLFSGRTSDRVLRDEVAAPAQ